MTGHVEVNILDGEPPRDRSRDQTQVEVDCGLCLPLSFPLIRSRNFSQRYDNTGYRMPSTGSQRLHGHRLVAEKRFSDDVDILPIVFNSL